MKGYRKWVILSIPAFLLLAIPVFALTSSDFLPKAQKYIDKNCFARRISNGTSLLCYLFFKSNEQDSILSTHSQELETLEASNAAQLAQLADLEQRIEELEQLLDQPEPKEVVFAQNRPQPFNSDWVDVRGGYSTITLNLSITGFIAEYAVHYTNDPDTATDLTGYVEQVRISCGGSTCPTTTLPILGDFYRISTGTASGNVTATGLLNP